MLVGSCRSDTIGKYWYTCIVAHLKEQCHEDFAVLGQFCAKIITWDLNYKQNASVKLRRRYQTNFIREC